MKSYIFDFKGYSLEIPAKNYVEAVNAFRMLTGLETVILKGIRKNESNN